MTKNICRYFPSVGRGRPLSLLRQTLSRVFLALTSVTGAPSAYTALFFKAFHHLKWRRGKVFDKGKELTTMMYFVLSDLFAGAGIEFYIAVAAVLIAKKIHNTVKISRQKRTTENTDNHMTLRKELEAEVKAEMEELETKIKKECGYYDLEFWK